MSGAEQSKGESGRPGGGQGRRGAVGHTGVYPASGTERPPGGAEIRMQAAWGQGSAGPSGEPTIDIHDTEGKGPARQR